MIEVRENYWNLETLFEQSFMKIKEHFDSVECVLMHDSFNSNLVFKTIFSLDMNVNCGKHNNYVTFTLYPVNTVIQEKHENKEETLLSIPYNMYEYYSDFDSVIQESIAEHKYGVEKILSNLYSVKKDTISSQLRFIESDIFDYIDSMMDRIFISFDNDKNIIEEINPQRNIKKLVFQNGIEEYKNLIKSLSHYYNLSKFRIETKDLLTMNISYDVDLHYENTGNDIIVRNVSLFVDKVSFRLNSRKSGEIRFTKDIFTGFPSDIERKVDEVVRSNFFRLDFVSSLKSSEKSKIEEEITNTVITSYLNLAYLTLC